jgi:hypothetical protein
VRKRVTLVIAVVFLALAAYGGYRLWAYNTGGFYSARERDFSENLAAFVTGDAERLLMKDLNTSAWVRACLIYPYTQVYEVERVLGMKTNNVVMPPWINNEFFVSILFANNDGVHFYRVPREVAYFDLYVPSGVQCGDRESLAVRRVREEVSTKPKPEVRLELVAR